MLNWVRSRLPACAIAWLLFCSHATATEGKSVDYTKVETIFAQHCFDCHGLTEPDANLVMETYELLMKGGESGAAVIAGNSSESLLVQMIEGTIERDGKKAIMPPGKRKKLQADEIAVIRAWIDAGAQAPAEPAVAIRELNVPKITPHAPPRRGIQALAYLPTKKLLAVARYGEVELISAEHRSVVQTLSGHRGQVNALALSADGSHLFAAAGEPALFGEVRQWKLPEGTLVRTFEGHQDAIYSVAVSPDGRTLATGSYDQKISLWNIETGTERTTLSGHNGAIFGLAFRPDGTILASASADRTVKLWEVATGERRDTLSQSLKELNALAFSPDGKRLVAGGVDNRIRVWQISETAAETTNPLLESRFAHEGSIVRIVFSSDGKLMASAADDRTVKIWDIAGVSAADPQPATRNSQLKERRLLERQPDWAPGLAFVLDNKTLAAGRLDGSLEFYDATTGNRQPPPKPELTRTEPRGIQRGTEVRMKLHGANLVHLGEVKTHQPGLTAQLEPGDGNALANEVWIRMAAAADLIPGPYEISVVGKHGASGKLQVHVDDLPQRAASDPGELQLPASIWGVHEKQGQVEELRFEVAERETLIFNVDAKSIGSKSDLVLTLLNSDGAVLASSNGFDGNSDPFLAYDFSVPGQYTVRVNELLLGASPDHFYRLSIGAIPFVTGCYPLSVPANTESEVELIGYHLPRDRTVKVTAKDPGEIEVPIDRATFRSRRQFKVLVSNMTEVAEHEPNDRPEDATMIPAPASVGGRIWKSSRGRESNGGGGVAESESSHDVDLFRFDAKAGETWIIETQAAQRGSPVDTKIEVLHDNGRPVERVLLQAVRNSAVTFRGIDSNTADCRVENWEEMDLNQFLYLQGEVVKLFRAPQGPDSGFLFYMRNGKRRTYFDTSPTTHANEEPCYIVEPHPPGTSFVPNGLPVFTVYYANDDDGERKLGTDSKIHFTAPADGSYLVRVTDPRGYYGARFAYRLVLRQARQDFDVRLSPMNPTVNRGSGQAFTVSADRMDGFEGAITLTISNTPPGLIISSPLVIEAGHTEARGTIFMTDELRSTSASDIATASTNITVTAAATVDGQTITKSISNFGRIEVGDEPKLYVAFEPSPFGSADPAARIASGTALGGTTGNALHEITIAPGQIVPAWLKIRRNGHEDLVTFTVENLPHGIIVDNIGLNGVLIPKGQNEREIFLTAARWVPETDRLCYAVENQAGRQTSRPVLIRVRKPQTQ